MINFQGEEYFDDRLYVLCVCETKLEFEQDGSVVTTIYHEKSPSNPVWCVVTYRNCPGYPIVDIKHFDTRERAVIYVWHIEPETPLISLNGQSPAVPLPYQEYLSWKKKNNLEDFDYKKVYASSGENPKEIMIQTKDQFKGIITRSRF